MVHIKEGYDAYPNDVHCNLERGSIRVRERTREWQKIRDIDAPRNRCNLFIEPLDIGKKRLFTMIWTNENFEARICQKRCS